jgi:hypothetical protein
MILNEQLKLLFNLMMNYPKTSYSYDNNKENNNEEKTTKFDM